MVSMAEQEKYQEDDDDIDVDKFPFERNKYFDPDPDGLRLGLSEEERLERKRLKEAILFGDPSEENVDRLRQRLGEWLEKHPNDSEMLGIGEMLVMLKSAYEYEREKRRRA